MIYTLYISNHCSRCDKVVEYLGSKNVDFNVINIDEESDSSVFPVMVIPALMLDGKLLAYGQDIVLYFEKFSQAS